MKIRRFLPILILAFVSSSASAFHQGGVGSCDGCHSMHNSQDGITNAEGPGVTDVGNGFLTIGSDPTSTCLTCHAGLNGGFHVYSTDGSNYNPGGDFFWLTRNYPGERVLGHARGHNVISVDYGMVSDTILTEGPSDGTVRYPAAQLGCNSCHDPHGKTEKNTNPFPIGISGSYGEIVPVGSIPGNYRLLGGAGYDGGEQVKNLNISFAFGAPLAKAPLFFAGPEGPTNFVAYGAGISEWCANCHTGFDSEGASTVGSGVNDHRHPASSRAVLPASIAVNYDNYVATGQADGSRGYDFLVPYEQGTTTYGETAVLSNTEGPASSTGGNVMCLSCHRAHATPFSDIGRWDFQVDLLVNSPQLNPAFPEWIHVYYGLDIATYYNEAQRSLCNKCHRQD